MMKKNWKMLPLERIWHYIIINLWSYFETYWLWLILKNFGLVFQTDLPSRGKNLSTDMPPPIVWMIHILWKRGCVKSFFRKDFIPLQILTIYYLLLYVLDLHKVKVLDIYGQGLQCHDQSVNLITDMQCCHQSHCGRFCWLLSWNWKCNWTDALYVTNYCTIYRTNYHTN